MNFKRCVELEVDEIPAGCMELSTASCFIGEAVRKLQLIQGRYDRTGNEDMQIAIMALSDVRTHLSSALNMIERARHNN